MSYDYKEGKKTIQDILNNNADIQEKIIPKDDSNFTYDNGIRSWIGSIFIDIVGSTNIIKKQDEKIVAKILRSFTSEVISVFNASDNVRQIGVRGDCVYGVFSTPLQSDTFELFNLSATLCSLVDMLNKLYSKKGYPTISVGIGVAIGNDLIIKAGKKGSGINDRIWIGNAVVDACNIANKAGRNGNKRVGFSSDTYSNFIGILEKKHESKDVKGWFNCDYYSSIYYASLCMPDMDEWVGNNI